MKQAAMRNSIAGLAFGLALFAGPAGMQARAETFGVLIGVSKLPAKQFVVLVDACREDPTPGRGLKGNPLSDKMSSDFQVVPQNGVRSAGSATFFACQIGERAYEDPGFKHGVFTYYVLDAI